MPVRRRSASHQRPLLLVAVLALCAFLVLTKPGHYLWGTLNLRLHALQWSLLGSPNYQATINRITIATGLQDGPPAQVTITVHEHALVSAVDRFRQQPLNARALSADPYTSLERLFAVIQDALDRGADEVSVSYDGRYGYPKRIQIDYNRQTYDDEVSIQVDEYVSTR
jgi:Family of unknown function (DUF6174)